MTTVDYYLGPDGILEPPFAVHHRDGEYDPTGFDALWAMQGEHFWYQGRHRFLLAAVERAYTVNRSRRALVDLGGGCGGWLHYLVTRRPGWPDRLALADSSRMALQMAGKILPSSVERYHVDLMNLGWQDHWNTAFLLDVIEHLPDDVHAMREACKALTSGGLLFVTAPALSQFWSYNDELVNHLRRYTRQDFCRLAQQSDLQLVDARYFMFLLSPLYWLARRRPGIAKLTEAEKRKLFHRAHRVLPLPVNATLSAIFACESPLGLRVRFPWGTSILGVFRKP